MTTFMNWSEATILRNVSPISAKTRINNVILVAEFNISMLFVIIYNSSRNFVTVTNGRFYIVSLLETYDR